MNDVNADAPPPGEWTVVGDDPGHKDHIPGWRKELLPEDDSEAQSLEIDPCFQYCYKSSLLPFKDRLNLDTLALPSKRGIIYNKDRFLRDESPDFSELEPLIVFNNNCIVRTNKKGLKESLRRRRDEDREEEQRSRVYFRGRGGRGRGRSGYRSLGREEGNSNEVRLGERTRSSSTRVQDRSRSPLLPRMSSKVVKVRRNEESSHFSYRPSHREGQGGPRGNEESRGREDYFRGRSYENGDRRDSYEGGRRDSYEGGRRDSCEIDRRDCRGSYRHRERNYDGSSSRSSDHRRSGSSRSHADKDSRRNSLDERGDREDVFATPDRLSRSSVSSSGTPSSSRPRSQVTRPAPSQSPASSSGSMTYADWKRKKAKEEQQEATRRC